jgi:hypothetical protein
MTNGILNYNVRVSLPLGKLVEPVCLKNTATTGEGTEKVVVFNNRLFSFKKTAYFLWHIRVEVMDSIFIQAILRAYI